MIWWLHGGYVMGCENKLAKQEEELELISNTDLEIITYVDTSIILRKQY